MFERLAISTMAGALARHAAERQSIVARNVANADTPGYKARDLSSFGDLVTRSGGSDMRATRTGHLTGLTPLGADAVVRADAEPSPNGNTVTLEDEMVAGAEIRQSHEMALGIYRSISSMMRSSLGRGA